MINEIHLHNFKKWEDLKINLNEYVIAKLLMINKK